MKSFLFFIILILIIISCTSNVSKKQDKDYFFTEKISNICECESMKWTKVNKNTAVFNFGFVKGNCCGDLPNPKFMKSKVISDTIFFTNGYEVDPNCNGNIGTCGRSFAFVINIKKYPHYNKLIWKKINNVAFDKLK